MINEMTLPPTDNSNYQSHQSNTQKAEITFCNQKFWLYADGSCYHCASKTLIIADLHLEKAFSQSSATPLPGYDTQETLLRLENALNHAIIERCIFLGDSFHSARVAHTLASFYKDKLLALTQSKNIVWVLGNHDPSLPNFLEGLQCDEFYIDKIELRHQLVTDSTDSMEAPLQGQIIGHYHPKAKLRLRAGSVTSKCFILDKTRMILPAFGVFTGGLNIKHMAISNLFSHAPELYFCHKTKLYHIIDVANLCK
jgi:uncharacterized protein